MRAMACWIGTKGGAVAVVLHAYGAVGALGYLVKVLFI